MTTQPTTQKTYVLDGTTLEVCSCHAVCPCALGDDPDGGECDAVNIYHIDSGQINGVDVSGLSLVNVTRIPGNVMAGNWHIVLYIDDGATPQQREALLDAFGGKLGGPLANMAELVSEILATYPATIEYNVEKGKGTLSVGQAINAEMAPYTDKAGNVTTLENALFSTDPGSPVYISKVSRNQVNIPEHGLTWEFNSSSALQSTFHFEA